MRRTTELEIEGVRYSTTQYPATNGNKLLIRMAKIGYKPVISVMSSAALEAEETPDLMNIDVTPDMIAKAIEGLMCSIDEEIADKLIKDILVTTEVVEEKGRKPLSVCFDVHFAGRYEHLYSVVKEVLAFQYGNFFAALVGVVGRLRREEKGAAVKAR